MVGVSRIGALVSGLSSQYFAFAQSAVPNPATACPALLNLKLENTTILSATHLATASNIITPGSCQSTATTSVALCRVFFVINTTATSAVHAEAWLPDTYFGRFLTVGNGGLGGCMFFFWTSHLFLTAYPSSFKVSIIPTWI